ACRRPPHQRLQTRDRHPRPHADRRRAAHPRRRGQRAGSAGAARREPRLVRRHHDGDVRDAQGLERRRPPGVLRLHARRARLADPLRAGDHAALASRRGAAPSPRGDRRQVPGASRPRGRGPLRRAIRDGL
ncbi:MAG: hypothetical protein AVDCRST_MAG38-979, partial [uncultured Solirubrobacteraceae bacterium]